MKISKAWHRKHALRIGSAKIQIAKLSHAKAQSGFERSHPVLEDLRLKCCANPLGRSRYGRLQHCNLLVVILSSHYEHAGPQAAHRRANQIDARRPCAVDTASAFRTECSESSRDCRHDNLRRVVSG